VLVLAALVTEDPLLLIGASGTGKTFLLNSLSEALGLEHRHYNASRRRAEPSTTRRCWIVSMVS